MVVKKAMLSTPLAATKCVAMPTLSGHVYLTLLAVTLLDFVSELKRSSFVNFVL